MGVSYSDLMRMTPWEFHKYSLGYSDRLKVEHEQKVSIAYMQALWTIQWLGKKKPDPLEKILGTKPKKKKEQKPEQMLEVLKQLNAAFGGETI